MRQLLACSRAIAMACIVVLASNALAGDEPTAPPATDFGADRPQSGTAPALPPAPFSPPATRPIFMQEKPAPQPSMSQQPAPFNPAPLGTYIQTTADQRVVITKSGYLMTTEINGRRDTSIATEYAPASAATPAR